MKRKKTKNMAILLKKWKGLGTGLFFLLFTSCSNVDESERFIYVAPTEVQKNVLIEDFTGQACVNCPAATAQIHELQKTYGEEKVIAVAIHSGPFAHRRSNMANAFLSDLGTAQGDDYYTHWGIEAQPGVKINRGAAIYDTKQYAAVVAAEMKKKSPIEFEKFQASIENNSIRVHLEPSVPTKDVKARLQLWIVEDSINATGGNKAYQQQLPDNLVDVNYVHNHVFRASMTGDPYGDAFAHGAGEKKQVVFEYSKPIEDTWNTENLSVVAFLWDDSDGVICVSRTKVQ